MRFVIQKHAASTLHYDLRLEAGGVLKLRGGWTLQRTRGGAKPQWPLIKRRDECADARRNPVSTQPESVLSGRTIEQL